MASESNGSPGATRNVSASLTASARGAAPARHAVSEHAYFREIIGEHKYRFLVSLNLPQIPYPHDVGVVVVGRDTIGIHASLVMNSVEGHKSVRHTVFLKYTPPTDCDLKTLRAALTPDARLVMIASRVRNANEQ